jgi:hypothetical protein
MHTSVLTKAIFGSLATALIAAVPLKAQDSNRWAGHVSLSSPGGDLSDYAKIGLGASLAFELPWKDKMGFRGRLEYTKYGEKSTGISTPLYNITFNTGADSIGIHCDYVFRVDSYDQGGYVFGGLGYLLGTLKVSGYGKSDSQSANGIVLNAGYGYNFTRNLGTEIKYCKALTVSTDFATIDLYNLSAGIIETSNESFAFDSIRVSFCYRF